MTVRPRPKMGITTSIIRSSVNVDSPYFIIVDEYRPGWVDKCRSHNCTSSDYGCGVCEARVSSPDLFKLIT